MTVTHLEIRSVLARYLERNQDEGASMAPLFHALDEGHDITSRTEFRIGHVTVGAAVIDPADRVLMIRHKVLDTWLLPGGHLEPEDADLLGASLRELEEETGIPWQQAVAPPTRDVAPLDIDIHTIPATPAKDEPEHVHIDIRYAHRVEDPAVRPQLDEVTDVAWRPISALPAGRLGSKLDALAHA